MGPRLQLPQDPAGATNAPAAGPFAGKEPNSRQTLTTNDGLVASLIECGNSKTLGDLEDCVQVLHPISSLQLAKAGILQMWPSDRGRSWSGVRIGIYVGGSQLPSWNLVDASQAASPHSAFVNSPR